MINRHKMILREIIANYFGASEDELCALGNITSKTLKSDIQVLDDSLKKYHLCLYCKDNRYYIPFEEKDQYLDAYDELIKEDENQMLSSENTERKIQLLIALCKSNEYISMNMLADKLYISKTSISSIIHELKKEVPEKVPEACLEISSHKGVRLIASEKQKRELLVRFFSIDDNPAKQNRYLQMYLEEQNKELLPRVQEKLNEFLVTHNFEIANDNINKLIMHLMVIIQRVEHHQCLLENEVVYSSLYDDLSHDLKDIGIEIQAKDLSSLPLQRINRAVIVHPIVNEIIEAFIEEIKEEYHFVIFKVEDTKSLAAHIDDLISRGSSSYIKQDFMYDQMLQRLLSAFLLSGNLCKIIEEKTNFKVNEENRFYLAMHIQWLYRKDLVINEKMLLYDSNISECEMLQTDLEKHFGSKATIKNVYLSTDINKEIEKDSYKIILSTKSVLGDFKRVPFLKIHSFLTNEDYDAIDKIVYKNKLVKIIDAKTRDNQLVYHEVKVPLVNEVIQIKGYSLTHTVCSNIDTGVYRTVQDDKTVFVFNYNETTDFLKYHRMINSFGQMIKENKVN